MAVLTVLRLAVISPLAKKGEEVTGKGREVGLHKEEVTRRRENGGKFRVLLWVLNLTE